MTDNAENVAEDITANLTALRQDVARLAETVSRLVQNQTQAAASRVYEAAGDAADTIASTATDAQKRVFAAGREVEALVGRNPLTAVLVALGVGISIGLVCRSRD